MKTCIKCGGSWAGAKEFDTLCAHDFDEPPEPQIYFGPFGACEAEWTYSAVGALPGVGELRGAHPTRDGAIAAWKAEWQRLREKQRQRQVLEALAECECGECVPTGAITREAHLYDGGTTIAEACEKWAGFYETQEDFIEGLRKLRECAASLPDPSDIEEPKAPAPRHLPRGTRVLVQEDWPATICEWDDTRKAYRIWADEDRGVDWVTADDVRPIDPVTVHPRLRRAYRLRWAREQRRPAADTPASTRKP